MAARSKNEINGNSTPHLRARNGDLFRVIELVFVAG
jgi:hypothetical protein